MTQLRNDAVAVFNKTKGNSLVAQNVLMARGFFQKLRGLMFRNELGEGEGLFLKKTSAIHTCFMRFPIDVVFLDRDDKVVKVVSCLKPWALWCGARGAAGVLELNEGKVRRCGIQEGDGVIFSSRDA